jgi:hypothetical protein
MVRSFLQRVSTQPPLGGSMKRFGFLSGILATLSGCGDPHGGNGLHTETWDSAGVRIIEHAAIPPDLPRWEVSADPDLVIGSLEGDGPDVFGRVESVVELSSGVIVVADGLRLEISAFDRSGEHLWSAGRQGEGPGEFMELAGAYAVTGDSIVVLEGGRSVSVFDAYGSFSRRLILDPPSDGYPSPIVSGVTRSGTLVARGIRMPRIESGYYRTSFPLATYDMNGSLVTDVGELPGTEAVLTVLDDGAYSSWLLSMGRSTQFAVGGDGFAASTQDRFEILRYDSTGVLEMIVRVHKEPIVVDDRVRRQYAEHGLDQIDDPETRRSVRRSRQQEELPETLPAVGRIRYDAADHLWVEEYVPPYDDRPPVWWVFDPQGTLVAQASVPSAFAMHQMEAEHAVGVVLDELDVPRVEVRRISQGEPGSVRPAAR